MKTKTKFEFVICISDDGYEDLEVWKIYRVIQDSDAEEVGCLRVLDESGEDYLYPEDRFVRADFPNDIRARLLAVPAK